MGYIVVALVSFLFGYALCFKWLGEDIIKGNLIKLNKDVYVASKVDTKSGYPPWIKLKQNETKSIMSKT